MPTILRFRGFRIVIFFDDHNPAHIHVFGKGLDVVYELNGRNGPVSLRAGETPIPSPNERRAVEKFLNDNLAKLWEAWEAIDDDR